MSEVNNEHVIKPEEKKVEATPVFIFKPYDVTVTAGALKLHKEPTNRSRVVRIVRKDTVLHAIDDKSGYLNVGDAWASKKYVKRK